MLMAADLQIELLENQFSPEYVETDAPVQEHRESLNSFKAEAKEQKRTGTAIDGRGDFGKLWRLFRFFVLGFLL